MRRARAHRSNCGWAEKDFRRGKQLGAGKTAAVYEAVCVLSGVTVALKIYNKARQKRVHSLCMRRRSVCGGLQARRYYSAAWSFAEGAG